MRAFVIAFILLSCAAAANAAVATAGVGRVGAPGMLCRTAISVAEQGQAIPAHLLAAIGRVESGRRDEATVGLHPWPWTINAEGQGSYFENKAQAIAAVRALQARGVHSIDVGCMQINLMYHPDAFAGLEQAFEPAANAAYGARFLRRLFVQSGSWEAAVGLYHSATPELAEPYRQKVLAVWPEEIGQPTPILAAAGLAAGHGGFLAMPPPIPGRIMQSAALPAQAPEPRGLAAYRSAPQALTTRMLRKTGRW